MKSKLLPLTRLAIGMAAMLSPTISSAAPIPVPYRIQAPEVFTLTNGLTVAFFEDQKIPLIDLVFVTSNGAADDPIGKSGTAQLLASLIDRSLEKSEEFAATRSVSADDDSITVHLHGLSSDTDSVMTLMKSVLDNAMKGDAFSEGLFQNEKKHLADSMSNLIDQPETLGALAGQRYFFAGTPYERGLFQSRNQFLSISRKEINEAFQQFFEPRKVTLIVIGRGNDALLKTKITAAFSTISAPKPLGKLSDSKFVKRSSKPSWTQGQFVLVDHPGMNQAQIELAEEAPSLRDADHPALVVANTILGEMFSSRLNRQLRDKMALTYSISSHFVIRQKASRWVIGSATRNSEFPKFIEILKSELKRFESADFTAQEVEQAKDYLLGGFPIATSTLYAAASRWMTGKSFGMPPDYLNAFQSQIAPITREQVSAVVKRHFRSNRFKILVVGDAKTLGPILKSANISFQTIKAKSLL